MARRWTWRRTITLTIALVAALLATSCSLREGMVVAGTVPPPDGEQMQQAFIRKIDETRAAIPLPPVLRDPALDELAGRALVVIRAGLPPDVEVFDHLEASGPELPEGHAYAVGFESRTPGLDPRVRDEGRRRGGVDTIEELLAGDPALDGLGAAAAGPWTVVVLRSRSLRPADDLALQKALDDAMRHLRPALRHDVALASIAKEVIADGTIRVEELARFGGAGEVPIQISSPRTEAHLPTADLKASLAGEGPGSVREPWLDRVGVAVNITHAGEVSFIVLATGKADRAPLEAELIAFQPKATDVINRARSEAGLPHVRLDLSLVESATRWLAESISRGCLVGYTPACAGGDPRSAQRWWAGHSTWSGAENAFTFYLAPAEPGDEQLKRFGAVALLAPDGIVWSAVVFAS